MLAILAAGEGKGHVSIMSPSYGEGNILILVGILLALASATL